MPVVTPAQAHEYAAAAVFINDLDLATGDQAEFATKLTLIIDADEMIVVCAIGWGSMLGLPIVAEPALSH